MRIPKRKGEILRSTKIHEDHYLTVHAIEKIKNEIMDLKTRLPEMIEEVRRTAENGDFSENAEYQFAKSRLRATQARIFSLEERVRQAIPITSDALADTVQIGSTISLQTGERTVVYTILGSQESYPSHGRISYLSPLGSSLMGKKVGEEVVVPTTTGHAVYHIISIS